MAKLTRAQELLLRAGVLTEDDLLGPPQLSEAELLERWNAEQAAKQQAADAVEANRLQIADYLKTPEGPLEAGLNAVRRGLYGADEGVSNIGADIQLREIANAENEAGLLDRLIGAAPQILANPTTALTDTLPDYLLSTVLRESLGAEGLGRARADAASTISENAIESARTAEELPMSAAAKRGLDPNETLLETLSRPGGIGDFAAGAAESTIESLTRSAPAIAATIATRGRGAPLILGADAAAQETAFGIQSYLADTYPNATPEQYAELLKDPEVAKAALDYTATRRDTVALGAMGAGALGARFLPKTGATTGQVVRNAAVTQPVIGATVDSSTEALAQYLSTGELNAKDIALEGAGGLVTQPAEVVGSYLGARNEAQITAARQKADAARKAAELGTESARGLAEAYGAGAEQAAAAVPPPIPIEQTLEVDQLDVAAESFKDTRFDRATKAIDTKLEELDTAASVVDQNQPLRRQNEESKANRAEIDQLRTYIETVQQEDRILTRDERRKVTQSIDRLNFLEQQEAGRKAIPEAKQIRSRLANAPDSELLTVAGEIDPSQNFTNLDGPDLSRLSTPQPLGSVPRRAANMATSQETADVEQGISLAYKDMDNEAKKQAKAEQKQVDAVSKARVEFARQYVKDNPGATPEVVREATMQWEQEFGGGPSRVEGAMSAPAASTPPPIPQATTQTTGPLTREQRIARMRELEQRNPEETDLPEGLDPGVLSVVSRSPRDRTAMTGDPEFDALLASLESNEAAVNEAETVRQANVAADTGANDDLRQANVEAGPRGVFNRVAQKAIETGDEVVSGISRRLAPLLEAIGTTIEFSDTPIRTANGSAAGMFIAGENKIQIAPETKSDKDRVEILAHEGLHAVLQGAYRQPDRFNGGTEAKELLDAAANRLAEARASGELAKIIDGIKSPGERKAASVLLSDADGLIFQADGSIEMDELITYANTSRPVQRVLQQIKMRPQSKKTVWSTIVEAAKRLLGTDISDTVLERVMQGTDKLLQAVESDVDTLRQVAAENQQEAVEAASMDRAATAVPKVDTFTRIIAPVSQQRPVASNERKVKLVSNMLRSAMSRAPAVVRESRANAEGMTSAITAQVVAQLNDVNAILGSPDRIAKFEGDVAELNKSLDKFANEKNEAKRIDMKVAISGTLNSLREEYGKAFDILEKVRGVIDLNSRELMKIIYDTAPIDSSGKKVLSKDNIRLLNSIQANIGRYVTRQYAINNPELAKANRERFRGKKITDKDLAILNAAQSFIEANDVAIPSDDKLMAKKIDNLREMYELWVGPSEGLDKVDMAVDLAEIRDSDKYTKAKVAELVDSVVDGILNKRGEIARRYISEAADDSILKKRENVPEPIRALMGETTSPAIAMMYTVYKQRQLINSLRMFNELADTQTGTLFFPSKAAAPDAGYVQLKGDEYGKLNGMWTSPQVKEVFDVRVQTTFNLDQAFADAAQGVEGLRLLGQKVNKITKTTMLLPAVPLYAYNFLGAVGTLVNTGAVTNITSIPNSMKIAFVDTPGVWAKREVPKDALEALRRGLVDSAIVGEIQDQEMRYIIDNLGPGQHAAASYRIFDKMGKQAGAFFRRWFDYYAAADMWVKFQVYASELKTLQELNAALPEGQRMTDDQVKRAAAEKTKRTTFSYERAIPLANMIEGTGISLFMRYMSETVRTSVNNVAEAKNELELQASLREEGNTAAADVIRDRATRRIIGQGVWSGMSTLVVGAISSLAQGVAGAFYDEEDDDELADDMVEIYKEDNEWMSSKDINLLGRIGAGTKDDPYRWVVQDSGRFDPLGPVTEPWRRVVDMLAGKGELEDVVDSIQSSFMTASPMLGQVFDFAKPRNPRVFREEGFIRDWAVNTGRIQDDDYKRMFNLVEMFLPNQGEFLLVETERPVSATVFGYNRQEVDPLKFLQSPGFSMKRSDAERTIRAKLAGTDILSGDTDAMDDVINEGLKADMEYMDSIRRRVRVAKAAGLDDAAIKAALMGDSGDRGIGLTKTGYDAIMNGNFTPLTLSDETLKTRETQALAQAESDAEKMTIRAAFRTLKTKRDEAIVASRRDF